MVLSTTINQSTSLYNLYLQRVIWGPKFWISPIPLPRSNCPAPVWPMGRSQGASLRAEGARKAQLCLEKLDKFENGKSEKKMDNWSTPYF